MLLKAVGNRCATTIPCRLPKGFFQFLTARLVKRTPGCSACRGWRYPDWAIPSLAPHPSGSRERPPSFGNGSISVSYGALHRLGGWLGGVRPTLSEWEGDVFQLGNSLRCNSYWRPDVITGTQGSDVIAELRRRCRWMGPTFRCQISKNSTPAYAIKVSSSVQVE